MDMAKGGLVGRSRSRSSSSCKRRSRYRLKKEARYLLLRQRYAKSIELDKRASMARERGRAG